ncbi:MFS transporter [Steroidobacter sp. S1-65]|uniref:MFS transporter n=2 Tax=Steroidobacter gossypii TaxID=2805490 RepID=A0ABS1X2C9_9GAMM|nr:MFS transporter [Steroidobacter gossypii]
MTITSASIALADVQGELQLGITQLQWVLNSFIVSIAVLLLPFGAWSDRIGQRPLFLWGAAVFVAGAIAAVLARDVVVLMAGRVIQGVGAALSIATGPAALALAFPHEAHRRRAFGYLGSSGGVGLALGALLAGVAAQWAGWRAALALPVPVMLTALVVVLRSPTAMRAPPRVRLGANEPATSLLSNRQFVLSCLICVLFTTVWVALFIYAPLHMQTVDGLDAGTTGTLMLALLLPALAMPVAVSRLVRVLPPAAVIVAGFLIIALGLACMDLAWSGATSRSWEIVGLGLCGCGAGALYGLVDYIGLSSVPPEQAGLASGAFNVVRLVGDILAAIVPGTVVLQVVAGTLDPLVGVSIGSDVLNEIAAGDLRNVEPHLITQARAALVSGMERALWALLALTALGVAVSVRLRALEPVRR